MRTVLAIVLALHGVLHLIGFVVPWRLEEITGLPYSTTAAWGRIEIGDTGARALGIAWLVGALAFLGAAFGVAQSAQWSTAVTASATAFSMLLCLAGAPAALPGLAIDAVILIVLAVRAFGPAWRAIA